MAIQWTELTTTAQIEELKQRSQEVPCLIYKHSTRCSISMMAQLRLEKSWNFDSSTLEPYYLDLIAFRNVSNYIAETFQVWHESPQVLLIHRGECIYDASHTGIRIDELEEALGEVSK